MKVILLKDIPGTGKKYDVKEIKDGYVFNFLFPKGLAKKATKSELAKLETMKKEVVIERKVQEDLLLKNLSELKGKSITVQEKANEKGHLFSAIHKNKIVEAMKKSHNIDINENVLALDKPIKEVGEFEIPIEIGDKRGSFQLRVENLEN